MKKTCVAVGMVVMVAGCANVRFGDLGHQRVVFPQDPTAPTISIAVDSANKDNVVIDQEPIVLPASASINNVTTIKWLLPIFSDYVFKPPGIAIGAYTDNGVPGPPPVNAYCSVDGTANGTACTAKVCTCSYTTPLAGTKYEYSVSVKNKTTGQDLLRLDPSVWN